MFEVFFTLSFLGNIGDNITTYMAMKTKKAREANPFQRFMFNQLGLNVGTIVVSILELGLFLFLWYVHSLAVMVFMTAVFFFVLYNNICVLRKLKNG